jgi:hypothetical protein
MVWRRFQDFSMRAIDFSHKNTSNESFWRKKFFEKFSPKNDQMAVFLEHLVSLFHDSKNVEVGND